MLTHAPAPIAAPGPRPAPAARIADIADSVTSESLERDVRRTLLFTTLAILIVLCLAVWYQYTTSHERGWGTSAMSTVSRQRLLGQQLVGDAGLLLYRPEDAALRRRITDTIAEMRAAQARIIDGNHGEWSRLTGTRASQEELRAASAELARLTQLAEQALADRQPSPDERLRLQVQLDASHAAWLARITHFLLAISGERESNDTRIERLPIQFLSLLLVAAGGIGFFVFRPMLSRMRRTTSSLEASERTLVQQREALQRESEKLALVLAVGDIGYSDSRPATRRCPSTPW